MSWPDQTAPRELGEQSDQDLQCLPFHLHLSDKFLYRNFREITANILVVQKIRIFTVLYL